MFQNLFVSVLCLAVGQMNFLVHELKDEEQVVELAGVASIHNLGVVIDEQIINRLKKGEKK